MQHGAIEWVEIPAIDLKKSTAFYASVFGWKVQSPDNWPDYPMFEDTSGRIGGGFTRNAKPIGEAGLVLYVTVDDIDKMVNPIIQNGGTMVQPRTHISPEVGSWASFRDPAGNLIGLFQRVAR